MLRAMYELSTTFYMNYLLPFSYISKGGTIGTAVNDNMSFLRLSRILRRQKIWFVGIEYAIPEPVLALCKAPSMPRK
jgi:hypothetical protein